LTVKANHNKSAFFWGVFVPCILFFPLCCARLLFLRDELRVDGLSKVLQTIERMVHIDEHLILLFHLALRRDLRLLHKVFVSVCRRHRSCIDAIATMADQSLAGGLCSCLFFTVLQTSDLVLVPAHRCPCVHDKAASVVEFTIVDEREAQSILLYNLDCLRQVLHADTNSRHGGAHIGQQHVNLFSGRKTVRSRCFGKALVHLLQVQLYFAAHTHTRIEQNTHVDTISKQSDALVTISLHPLFFSVLSCTL
jgi:hypothetical protein